MIRISIVIPIIPEEDPEYVYKTVEGIERTIGLSVTGYTITFVGNAPNGLYSRSVHQNWNIIPSRDMVGTKRNKGAEYAIQHFDPDVLVFMDAHMNFYDDKSKNWGVTIHKFLKSHPDSLAAPAVSVYDNPQHRGFGMRLKITEGMENMDISWTWWGDAGGGVPFEVPGLCACFMAMRPQAFKDSVVGFTPYFRIEDGELSMRLWLLGKTFYSIPEITVGHRFSTGGGLPTTTKQSIEWGAGQLLHAFLNLDESAVTRLYEKGIHGSQNKSESLRLATSLYWRQVRQELLSKRVRTPEQYFRRFAYI